MGGTNDSPGSEETNVGNTFRQTSTGLVRYVKDNPLAALTGALVVGVILVRFAFLGNPKEG